MITPEWLGRLRALGTNAGMQGAGMAEFYQRFGNRKFGTDRYPLHDPCVIGYLLQPALFGGRHCHIAIDLVLPLTAGMTVIAWWNVTKKPPNCMVLRELDDDRFYALMLERLSRLP